MNRQGFYAQNTGASVFSGKMTLTKQMVGQSVNISGLGLKRVAVASRRTGIIRVPVKLAQTASDGVGA